MTFVRTPPRPPRTPSAAPPSGDVLNGAGDASVTEEALDALTALFLTPSEPAERNGAPATPAAPPRPVTELLVPGHLPVRGNLWLTPYADAIAQQHGCCGLLRIDDADEFSVQVLRGGNSIRPNPDASAREVVESFAPQVHTWMVRPRTPLNFDELVTAGADRLTILTGTDGISVVAAYQLIKDLAAAADSNGVSLPQLGLTVVGAAEEAAIEVVRRINLTAASFLREPLALRLCLPRIDAVAPCTQHATFSGEAAPQLREAIEWIKRGGEQSSLDMVEDRPSRREPAMPEHIEQRTSSSAATVQRNGDDAHSTDPVRSHTSFRLAPKPAENPRQSAKPQVCHAPSLVEHMAGLMPLRPRCPHHEMIELAVDDAGVLHLVGRADHLRELHSVKAWATDHRELLAMACADHTIDRSAQPVCHVVTDAPASVADLHGSGLRLHVLAPVNVNGQTAWYAAPLN